MGSEALVTLREALSNVARHARATRTEITLAASGDGLLLTVIDDGIGPAPSTPQMGRGLANMAERAEALGGTFRLVTGPEGGTRLEWRVPLT